MKKLLEQDWVAKGKEALDIEIEGLQTVRDNLDPEFNTAIELLAKCKGRVIISGIGKSGLVGRKLAATFSSTGTPSFFMHPVEGQHGDLGSIREEDLLIAISNSGRTDELNAIIPPLKAIGVKVLALTGWADSPLAGMADVTLNTWVPREACPLNLAPTSSTTAVLAIGDALAVCLIHYKAFTENDFKRVHPGGTLGQRLSLEIRAIMRSTDLPLTTPDTRIDSALKIMDQGRLGSILIMQGNKVEGIFTDGDLRRTLCQGSFDPQAPISSIMTTCFSCAKAGQSAAEVLYLMESKAITVMPVIDPEGSLLGIIHMHDLLGQGKIKFGI